MGQPAEWDYISRISDHLQSQITGNSDGFVDQEVLIHLSQEWKEPPEHDLPGDKIPPLHHLP